MTDQPRLTKQQEREQRILDAAADLILRWGYDKTAMDDIPERSGVAKGTIYLHRKTREELFDALLASYGNFSRLHLIDVPVT